MFGFSSDLLIELQYLYSLSNILYFPCALQLSPLQYLQLPCPPTSITLNLYFPYLITTKPALHPILQHPHTSSTTSLLLSSPRGILLSHNLFLFSGLPNAFLQSCVGADWSAQLLSLACQTQQTITCHSSAGTKANKWHWGSARLLQEQGFCRSSISEY